MSLADLGDVSLFYTDEGDPVDETPLLFVHGFACDSQDWSFQLPAFAATHRVVAYDQRGHGGSSVPAGGYDPTQLADDAASLIRHLALGPVVAVGHSLGAGTVLILAANHPELTRGIVTVDLSYPPDDARGRLQARAEEAAAESGRETAAEIISELDGPTTPLWLRTWHRRRALAMPHTPLAQVLTGILNGTDAYVLQSQGAVQLARVQCPILSFRVDPAGAAWEAAQMRHPLSKVVSWEATAHWLHRERPEEFNRLVRDWVDRLSSGG